jgi:hypothetical protein
VEPEEDAALPAALRDEKWNVFGHGADHFSWKPLSRFIRVVLFSVTQMKLPRPGQPKDIAQGQPDQK